MSNEVKAALGDKNSSTLVDLSKPFKYYEHEYNQQGHVYVGIPYTIRRLNEVAVEWNFTCDSYELQELTELTDEGLKGIKTRKGGKQYQAVVCCHLAIPGLGTRLGTGSDDNFNADNAIKSAQAYALRKASNLFGMALYLWDDNWRKLIKFMQTADLDDLTDLQECAKLLVAAKRNTLGLKGKMQDKDYILELLRTQGLIDQP